ncbi:zinc-dependent metalloprotease [Bergeyella sp. RCAD1439]|uniref:zinc-dependent metalloprotease n=1 Tax=Bergeyella anatis TaxID=3113737 RepID=UPI002E183764|nr:zinc-dependent metalloprotease [Bergeyella sp. RCAD1439]
MKKVWFCFFVWAGLSCAMAQETKKENEKKEAQSKTTDSLGTKTTKYEELTKGAVLKSGLFNVYQKKGDVFFEITPAIEGKDLLIVNKLSTVNTQINEAGVNKGINYENQIIRFYIDKKNNKVWAKTFDPKVSVPEGDRIAQSVRDNYAEAIIEGFDIKAYAKDSARVVFQVNKVFNGSSKSFNNLFDNIGIGSAVKSDRSYIDEVKVFPENIVVKSVLSSSVTENKETANLTILTTTNLILLPEPMVGRFSDHRVGYFTTKKSYYSDEQQAVQNKELITRWRLEPKPEDVDRYLKGELVEPRKKIVYYLDPATPKQWQQAILDGVKDWGRTFEKAGFKNAIEARMPLPEDKDFDPDDVRYSVITYAASEKANAMGPSVVDPRSGEILEADIVWWHNVMSLLQTWMRVQTGIIDPQARGNKLPVERMANAVRFASSHEVGHTLGLKHNMGASFAFDVEKLRDPSFTSEMGGTAPSIMDYARFNYIAQEGDGVTQITPQIGVYDEFAIHWGYRWTGAKSPFDEVKQTRAWIERHAKDPLYFYGAQQEEVIDPRSQSEDLGNDAMKAGEYGLNNLKKSLANLVKWTTNEGESYEEAKAFYNQIINQWQVYNSHVLANIGGIYLNPNVYGDGQVSYQSVPYEVQKRAVDYLARHVVVFPKWLFVNQWTPLLKPAKSTPKGAVDQSPYNVFREKQAVILYNLLRDDRLLRLQENEFNGSASKEMTALELFEDLRKVIFAKTIRKKNLNIYERMTQKNYIDALIIDVKRMYEKTSSKSMASTRMPMICDYAGHFHHLDRAYGDSEAALELYFTGMKRLSDVGSLKRGELIRVRRLMKMAAGSGDAMTRSHYEDTIIRLDEILGK